MLLLLAACGNGQGRDAEAVPPAPEASGGTVKLTVSAAASLTDALEEIKAAYESEHPDTLISFNFGASGALQQQIENGAPADLFLSAADRNMRALVDAGLIEESKQTALLRNELVLVAASDDGAPIRNESDLTNPDIRTVAIGIPETVPAGSYAKEALVGQNLWDSLQHKLVQAKDVRQVLQYVETGNADAGFVYKTDALTSDKAVIAATVDPSSYTPITYPIGIVKGSAHPDQAEALYDYLRSEKAMAVFAKYGFSAAGPS
ncbi:molybdate ABC transporter substrate-binding protein [Paenibacillus thailandensis]|uniref:Molybdate ABC transporter substrate-binding protein n=1 Tax=Paenibacillus thailandensis TaxID=393250 RepID=A0ABW5QY72_9BACL